MTTNLRKRTKSGICLLIAPVPVHCFSITFMLLCFYSTEGEPVSNKYLTCRMNLSVSDHEQGTIDRNIQVLQFLEVLSSSVVGVYNFLLENKTITWASRSVLKKCRPNNEIVQDTLLAKLIISSPKNQI